MWTAFAVGGAAMPPSDEDALARMRSGDHDAYVILYERYSGAARRLASPILPRSDVDDVVAEVFAASFAASFAAIRRGRGRRDDFGPYVLSAVRRECYRSLRRRGRRRETPANRTKWSDRPCSSSLPTTRSGRCSTRRFAEPADRLVVDRGRRAEPRGDRRAHRHHRAGGRRHGDAGPPCPGRGVPRGSLGWRRAAFATRLSRRQEIAGRRGARDRQRPQAWTCPGTCLPLRRLRERA